MLPDKKADRDKLTGKPLVFMEAVFISMG